MMITINKEDCEQSPIFLPKVTPCVAHTVHASGEAVRSDKRRRKPEKKK